MSVKWKATVSIFVFALSIFMMIETQYLPPLGDLILEAFGLKSWSNGDTGFHLTVLYFGLVTVMSGILVKRFAYMRMKMRGITIFLIIIVLMTSFTYATHTTAEYLKKNSDGLNALALVGREKAKTLNFFSDINKDSQVINNALNYNTRAFNVTDFDFDLTLKNYGDKEATFYIEFKPVLFENGSVDNLEIRNMDGSKAEFTLESGQTHRFVITEDMYQLTGGERSENGSYGLKVSEVILSNRQGEKIVLKENSIIAEVLIHKNK